MPPVFQTGDLVRIMSGEELSSTDLHLACNDTLLVGQVAEITQVDPNDNLATSRVHHRKLQVKWNSVKTCASQCGRCCSNNARYQQMNLPLIVYFNLC